MKKLIALIAFAVFGFYVAWPAWSGYRIYSALESEDTAALQGKIDFDSVRASLRPAVTKEAEKQFDGQLQKLGGGVPLGDLKSQLLPKLVDATLATIVTPANIVRIYREKGDIAASVNRIMTEQLQKSGTIPGLGNLPGVGGGAGSGGLGGLGNVLGGLSGSSGQFGIPALGGVRSAEPAKTPAPATPSAKTSFGLSNIKRLALTGPLGLEFGVAKDAAKAGPDVTASLRFTGLDWKLVSLVPTL